VAQSGERGPLWIDQRGSLSDKLRYVNMHLAAVCDLGPWHGSPRNVKRSRGPLADATPRDPLCPDYPPGISPRLAAQSGGRSLIRARLRACIRTRRTRPLQWTIAAADASPEGATRGAGGRSPRSLPLVSRRCSLPPHVQDAAGHQAALPPRSPQASVWRRGATTSATRPPDVDRHHVPGGIHPYL
jgi:hypothetical protein